MPAILNMKNFVGSVLPDNSVYVGRGKNNIFGNPFSHLPNSAAEFLVKDRDTAIRKYEEYARKRIAEDDVFAEAVKNLYGKDLICWCAPLSCHAEVLIKLSSELNLHE